MLCESIKLGWAKVSNKNFVFVFSLLGDGIGVCSFDLADFLATENTF